MLSQEFSFNSGTTLLVVDDHQDIRSLTAVFLRHSGFHVEGVETGEAAIGLLQKRILPVVIADLHLPGKCDGIALLAYHKRVCPEGGRILLTADFSEGLRVICNQIDAIYLPKPIPLPDLLLKVKGCLAKKHADALGSLSPKTETSQTETPFTKLQQVSWRSYFGRKVRR